MHRRMRYCGDFSLVGNPGCERVEQMEHGKVNITKMGKMIEPLKLEGAENLEKFIDNVFAGAGFNVRWTLLPEWRPIPTQAVSRFNVLWQCIAGFTVFLFSRR